MSTDVFDRFPALRYARQPAATCNARYSASEWGKNLAGFRLRAPAPSTEGLFGFRGAGDCLVPYILEGDVVWIDPNAEPQHGDFVVVRWSDAGYKELQKWANKDALAHLAKLGRSLSRVATKRLIWHHERREWFLMTAPGNTGLELADNHICGVVRMVQRGSSAVHTEAHAIKIEKVTLTNSIGPNAATEIFLAEDAGPDSFNPAVNGDGYVSISESGIDSAAVLVGRLTFEASLVDPVTTLGNVALSVTWSGGAQSSHSTQILHTDSRGYTVQQSFDSLPANTAWTMKVAVSGNGNITLRNVALIAEVIKR